MGLSSSFTTSRHTHSLKITGHTDTSTRRMEFKATHWSVWKCPLCTSCLCATKGAGGLGNLSALSADTLNTDPLFILSVGLWQPSRIKMTNSESQFTSFFWITTTGSSGFCSNCFSQRGWGDFQKGLMGAHGHIFRAGFKRHQKNNHYIYMEHLVRGEVSHQRDHTVPFF